MDYLREVKILLVQNHKNNVFVIIVTLTSNFVILYKIGIKLKIKIIV